MTLENLEVEEINLHLTAFQKTLYQLDRGLPVNDVAPRLRAQVEIFRAMYPTLVDLKNPNLKPRHWERIQESIGHQLIRDENLTLTRLRELSIFDFKDEISTVGAQASSEYTLEEMLNKIARSWNETEFIILPYRDIKDVYILGSVDEIQVLFPHSRITF